MNFRPKNHTKRFLITEKFISKLRLGLFEKNNMLRRPTKDGMGYGPFFV
jgi:hypothetical protein